MRKSTNNTSDVVLQICSSANNNYWSHLWGLGVDLPAPAVFVGERCEGSPPDPPLTLLHPFGVREAS
jgi:hypothetical protein